MQRQYGIITHGNKLPATWSIWTPNLAALQPPLSGADFMELTTEQATAVLADLARAGVDLESGNSRLALNFLLTHRALLRGQSGLSDDHDEIKSNILDLVARELYMKEILDKVIVQVGEKREGGEREFHNQLPR